MRLEVDLIVLTYGVSGPNWIRSDSKWTKSKSVLCSDPKQVILTLQETWDYESLACTGCIHLKIRN